ncbi:hypothetical protein OQA88_8339 [Cercophora sp. LCS_1]
MGTRYDPRDDGTSFLVGRNYFIVADRFPHRQQNLVIRYSEPDDRSLAGSQKAALTIQRVKDDDSNAGHVFDPAELDIANASPNTLAVVVGLLLLERPERGKMMIPEKVKLPASPARSYGVVVTRVTEIHNVLYALVNKCPTTGLCNLATVSTKDVEASLAYCPEWVGPISNWVNLHGKFRAATWSKNIRDFIARHFTNQLQQNTNAGATSSPILDSPKDTSDLDTSVNDECDLELQCAQEGQTPEFDKEAAFGDLDNLFTGYNEYGMEEAVTAKEACKTLWNEEISAERLHELGTAIRQQAEATQGGHAGISRGLYLGLIVMFTWGADLRNGSGKPIEASELVPMLADALKTAKRVLPDDPGFTKHKPFQKTDDAGEAPTQGSKKPSPNEAGLDAESPRKGRAVGHRGVVYELLDSEESDGDIDGDMEDDSLAGGDEEKMEVDGHCEDGPGRATLETVAPTLIFNSLGDGQDSDSDFDPTEFLDDLESDGYLDDADDDSASDADMDDEGEDDGPHVTPGGDHHSGFSLEELTNETSFNDIDSDDEDSPAAAPVDKLVIDQLRTSS